MSAESDKLDAYVQQKVFKTMDQKMRIQEKLNENFLFQGLDFQQQSAIIDAMTERKVSPGEFVIRQGRFGFITFITVPSIVFMIQNRSLVSLWSLSLQASRAIACT